MEPLLLLVFLIPLFGAALITLLPGKSLHWVTVICAFCAFLLFCMYIPDSIDGITKKIPLWMNPFAFTLFIDRLSLLLALIMSFLFTMVSIYSFYMKRKSYHVLILLDLVVLLLSILSQSLLGFYICLEMSTVITYFLIIYKRTPQSIHAGFIYIVMNISGAIVILMGILLRTDIPSTAAVLFVTGCLVKAGCVPVHIWLAHAHPIAPSPVSALLSGIMVKVGIYGLIRFSPLFNANLSILLIIALASMLIGAFSALLQSDIKKILAYSTISQLGFILLGISLLSDMGEAGGVLHMMNHALFKGLLFLSMGAVIYSTGTRDLHNLGGLANHLPITTAACLVGSLAISGIPPFNGYVSKCLLFEASPSVYVSVLFSLTCAGTVASFIKLFRLTFMGSPGKSLPHNPIPLSMKVSLIVLSSLCVFTGVFAHHILAFAGYAVEIHAWNISHLWQIGLNGALGIAVYGIGMKTGLILNPPQIRVTIDRFYHMSGRIIEYMGTVLHEVLLQDINYYALSIFVVLIALYILFSL
jgi:multicomponent Na+:H+ antiporter subunit D